MMTSSSGPSRQPLRVNAALYVGAVTADKGMR